MVRTPPHTTYSTRAYYPAPTACPYYPALTGRMGGNVPEWGQGDAPAPEGLRVNNL
ncbi:MAG: hypothetical protein AAFQ80_03165 [Cyanobacteria bacterium J06621_8]